MKNDIVLIDLFSGIGGFSKGLSDAGYNITKHYFSEIELHAIANYKYNFPNAEYIGSVINVSGAEIRSKHPSATIFITFGFPCQDLSIAGKRLGFKGERSSLFYHAARLVREAQANTYIWENVSGLMSSNKGKNIEAVFEEMYLSGYVFDVEELNTAWVIPQNRVRIYSVGHNIKYLQKCLIETDGMSENYNTYVKILEGILLMRYPQYLTEVLSLSEQKRNDLALGYLKIKEQDQYRGLILRRKFLEIIKEIQLQQLWHLYQIILPLQLRQSDLSLNTSLLTNQSKPLTDIRLASTESQQMGKEKLIMSIEMLLKTLSDESLQVLSKSIILILKSKTTCLETYSYAEMQKNIEIFIIHLSLSYRNCWNEALLNLIERKKNINYATKNRGNKSESAQENSCNDIFFSPPDKQENVTERHIGAECTTRILPITENDIRATKGASNTTTVRTITGGEIPEGYTAQ